MGKHFNEIQLSHLCLVNSWLATGLVHQVVWPGLMGSLRIEFAHPNGDLHADSSFIGRQQVTWFRWLWTLVILLLRHSAAFRAVSVWHVQSDRPPSLKNHCGHGVCSNGWVKLFILESGRVPAACHSQFEVCVTNHLQDCPVFLRCERLVYGICMCRIVGSGFIWLNGYGLYFTDVPAHLSHWVRIFMLFPNMFYFSTLLWWRCCLCMLWSFHLARGSCAMRLSTATDTVTFPWHTARKVSLVECCHYENAPFYTSYTPSGRDEVLRIDSRSIPSKRWVNFGPYPNHDTIHCRRLNPGNFCRATLAPWTIETPWHNKTSQGCWDRKLVVCCLDHCCENAHEEMKDTLKFDGTRLNGLVFSEKSHRKPSLFQLNIYIYIHMVFLQIFSNKNKSVDHGFLIWLGTPMPAVRPSFQLQERRAVSEALGHIGVGIPQPGFQLVFWGYPGYPNSWMVFEMENPIVRNGWFLGVALEISYFRRPPWIHMRRPPQSNANQCNGGDGISRLGMHQISTSNGEIGNAARRFQQTRPFLRLFLKAPS